MTQRRLFAAGLAAGLFVAAAAFPFAPAEASPDLEKGGGAFIESLAKQAVDSLADQAVPRPERIIRFRRMFNDSFAVEVIGRWILGRYWREASEVERAEYLRLFEDLIVNTYAERFERYGGEKLVVVGASQEGDQDPVVQTAIVRPASDQQFKVDWRLRRRQGRLMIVDVIVEGVSMGQTQRSEFASAIRQSGGGLDDFLAMLKKRVNGTA